MSTQFVQIQLASPNDIARWSEVVGPDTKYAREVLHADTINYRSFNPEKGGLFCEKIFGPLVSGRCGCGKTKRGQKPTTLELLCKKDVALTQEISAPKTITDLCPVCGIPIANARVRRYRMGRITLPKPVVHLWYFKNTPNVLRSLLPLKTKDILDIIYFCRYWATSPNTTNYCLLPEGPLPKKELSFWDAAQDESRTLWDAPQWEVLPWFFAAPKGLSDQPAPWNINPTIDRQSGFQTIENTGGQAIADFLSTIDFEFLERTLTLRIKAAKNNGSTHKEIIRNQLNTMETVFSNHSNGQTNLPLTVPRNQARGLWLHGGDRVSQRKDGIDERILIYVARLRCIRGFMRKKLRPEWMVLPIFPVLPPDLRPMIQMSSGRFATADINDLYRRLIYRKQRFDRVARMFDSAYLPDLLVRHDLILMQEAADAIIDNGRLAKPVVRANRTLFKSLTAVIEGKHGRFRQNLLGKRVDYSGRSVIVVGPKLQLHQCGLPREMALELFQPFVIRALLSHADVANIRAAKNLIQRRTALVWQTLETVVHGHPVLLNRAPTLHRVGIQAFEPVLLPGRAIQLHPLVCPAFNADFDGDQIAVHIPLSLEAQAEARLLMLATLNWLSPATGEPNILPSQDMILGFYYLTASKPTQSRKNQKVLNKWRRTNQTVNQGIFSTFEEVLQSFSIGKVKLHDWIWVRWYAGVHGEQPAPQQIILSQSGHIRAIYQNHIMEESVERPKQVNLSNYACIPTKPLTNNEFFIRTTPGRVIFNNLLYEHLFL